MRTTLNLHEDLVDEARKATGINEKTALVHAGLQALVDREKARRLAALGGSEPALSAPRRRRAYSVIVDTSVWIQHLRKGEPRLRKHLEQGILTVHPFIVGELACGNLRNRTEVLALLASLPVAPVIEQDELLGFLGRERLFGRGIGWVDVHLLASARLSGLPLWTLDRRLAEAAIGLGVAG